MGTKIAVMVLALAVVVFASFSATDALAKGYKGHYGGYGCCGKHVTTAYHGCGGYYGGYWPGLYMGPYGKYRPGYKRGGGFLPGLGGLSFGSFGFGSY
jgi:hypothetical protein